MPPFQGGGRGFKSRPGYQSSIRFKLGFLERDLNPQLVHNHSLLHDRTAFEDWPEPDRRRHLLRLWLAPEQARLLPPVFAERYGSVVPGDCGVSVPGMRFTVAREAEEG